MCHVHQAIYLENTPLYFFAWWGGAADPKMRREKGDILCEEKRKTNKISK
jgi:hypothetical protein